jgi:hypothetical protein
VDVAHKWSTEAVDEELDRLISRRASQDRRPDPDEQDERWKMSVAAYNGARIEENRQAWTAFHEQQAQRHRRTLQELISYHERRAQRLLTEGDV